MIHLNFNHLYYFYTIAKSGSLKHAAINLGISQSTLSEQIKSLETHYRTKLFTREARNLSLNAAGRRLFARIDTFFSSAGSLESATQWAEDGAFKPVEIGITTTISKTFAFEILRPLFSDRELLIRITESTVDHLLVDFKHQAIDILVTHEKLSGGLIKRLRSVPLREPEMALVAGAKFKAVASDFPNRASGCPYFLFTNRTPLRWEIEKFFKANNITPALRGEIDDVELLKAAAIDGLGITALPTRTIKRELEQKKLFILAPLPMSDVRIYAYYIGENVDGSTEKAIRLLEKKR